jgi:hypothetical protein
MLTRRRRRWRRYTRNLEDLFGRASEREMAPNSIASHAKLSRQLLYFDSYNSNNTVMIDRVGGTTVYTEPCPNRRDNKLTRRSNRINKKRFYVEGF